MPVDDELASLLALDPAALAIRASKDAVLLEKLKVFAEKVQHYVGLFHEQPPQPEQQSTSLENENGSMDAEQEIVKKEAQDERDNADHKVDVRQCNLLSAQDVGCKDEETCASTTMDLHKSVVVKQEKEENGDDEVQRHPTDDEGHVRNQNLSGTPKLVTCADVKVRNVKRKEVNHTASPNPRISRKRHKREQTQQSSTSVVVHAALPFPRQYDDSYDGSLRQTALCYSEGQTRKVLNANLERLGLTAKFSIGVISKRGNKVSHITLHHIWNDLPKNESETLEWWLGDGPKRLELVSALDPSKQKHSSIAVFWAERTASGPAKCHYVGHYQCIRLEPQLEVTFKGKKRQALLEFCFRKFDTKLANVMSSL